MESTVLQPIGIAICITTAPKPHSRTLWCRAVGFRLRNTWEKFEGPYVGLDPVVEILIRCGVGKGVVGSAQYRHKHRSRFRCTGLCQRQRNPGSGPVDKQFFARPVFLPPDHILSLLSATVEIAKRL